MCVKMFMSYAHFRASVAPEAKGSRKEPSLSKMLNTLIIAINNKAGWSVHGVNTFNTILIFSLLQEPQIVMATKQKNRSQY